MKKRLYTLLVIIGVLLVTVDYLSWRLHRAVQWRLPAAAISQPTLVKGGIVSVPSHRMGVQSFYFRCHVFNGHQINQLFKLSWYRSDKVLALGQVCHGEVRLKPAHALNNPQDNPLQRLALPFRYRAKGYVYRLNWFCDKAPVSMRQQLVAVIQGVDVGPPLQAILVALTIGSQSLMSSDQWQVLRKTGTNHLLAISGLHLGLVAWFTYVLVGFLWRRSARACLCMPAPIIAICLTLAAITAYAALCGFAVPVKRAWIMTVCFMLASLCAWHWPSMWRLAMAAVLVVLIQPWDVLSPGFCLSFYVVAWLVAVYPRLSHLPAWQAWPILQAMITVTLLPIVLYFFHGVTLVGFIANSVAIPWVSFVVIPLCLIATALSLCHLSLGGSVFWLAAKTLNWLWLALQWLADHPAWYWSYWPVSVWQCLVLWGAIVVTLSFRLGRWRLMAVPLLMCVFLFRAPQPRSGQIWGCMLDVGQGLSVVLRTAHHVLIYDVGARYPFGFDAGAQVVVPILQSLHIKKIDTVMISHGDNDHIGGLRSVLQSIPVSTVVTSVPRPKIHLTEGVVYQRCHRGQHWRWDGVDFDVLYPPKHSRYRKNDSSCVLRVSAGDRHLLLTGDIEHEAEQWLLAHQRASLPASIVQVPHHGSDTSSAASWLLAVHPVIALNSAGFYNRYGFPAGAVLQRYHHVGASFYNTAKRGALCFKLFNPAYPT